MIVRMLRVRCDECCEVDSDGLIVEDLPIETAITATLHFDGEKGWVRKRMHGADKDFCPKCAPRSEEDHPADAEPEAPLSIEDMP